MTSVTQAGRTDPQPPDDVVPVLLPQLPTASELLPWLQAIDAARQYTNFGPLVLQLQAALAETWRTSAGAPEVVTLCSCTAALELGMAALRLPAGSRVLMPDFGFPAAAHAARSNQLQPVFGDVDPASWQLTPALAKVALARMPLGLVVPVATFGCPVDAQAWDQFSTETGVPVLIDAAAAFGNQAIGKHAPVVFSFHATKPFGMGEGGALVTRDPALAMTIKRHSNFGFDTGVVVQAGSNAKMSEYAAAVGLALQQRWPQIQVQRRLNWQRYRAALAGIDGIELQAGFDAAMNPANVVVRLPVRADAVAPVLSRMGVASRRWYCPVLHQHPHFADCLCLGLDGTAAVPVSDRLSAYSLGLPWFSTISAAQQARVIDALVHALAVALPAARPAAEQDKADPPSRLDADD